MAAFDPDAFLAEQAPFDPDAFLADDPVEASRKEAASQGITAGLHALDTASGFGIPTILGAKDALFGEDSAKTDPVTGKAPQADKAKSIIDRYYANKKFYSDGMKRESEKNPLSAVTGQLAPAVLTAGLSGGPTTAKGIVGAGTVLGGAYGATRGPSETLRGDIAGTAEDTLEGGAVGALTSGAGVLGGKLISKGGSLAGKGYDKVLAEVARRTASKKGAAGKVAQDAVGGVENAWMAGKMRGEAGDGYVPNVPAGEQTQARLLNRREGNAEKAIDAERELFNEHGSKLRPGTQVLDAQHMQEISDEAKRGAWDLAKRGAAVGGAAAIHPGAGVAVAAAVGGGNLKSAAMAAAKHPATLRRLMALKPVGEALGRYVGKQAPTAALLYTLAKKHPEIEAELLKPDLVADAP